MAAIAVAVLLAAVLWGLESRQSWREETGADNDGLMEPRPVHTAPADVHVTTTLVTIKPRRIAAGAQRANSAMIYPSACR